MEEEIQDSVVSEGDRNISYFHKMALSKRRPNFITSRWWDLVDRLQWRSLNLRFRMLLKLLSSPIAKSIWIVGNVSFRVWRERNQNTGSLFL